MLGEIILFAIAFILVVFGIIGYWYWQTKWSVWMILIGITILMGIIVGMVVSYH